MKGHSSLVSGSIIVLGRTDARHCFWVPEPIEHGCDGGNVRHAIGHGLIYRTAMPIVWCLRRGWRKPPRVPEGD